MQQPVRFVALDALRGLAIALMILVNTPGSWSHVYSPLLHAPWHGFTFADIVFPGFLFVVGAAMFYALKHASLDRATVLKIFKRSALMFLCGVFLNWFWGQELATLRVMGVLQRIAVCYAVAALLILALRRGNNAASALQLKLPIVAAALLVGYWLLLQLGSDPYGLEGNIVRQLDLTLFGAAHLYQGFGIAFDPEGILSCLPAVVNVLLGYWVAVGLAGRNQQQGFRWLLAVGAILVLLALGSSYYCPINKALWTGSYVALSGGLLVWLLALMVWLVDIKGWRAVAEPLQIYGSNPLFIYMLSWIWAVIIGELLVWQHAGQALSVYQFGFDLLATVFPEKFASLVFALLHVLLFWLVSLVLYRKKIFIKL
jgi:predicted acyltransferase